jgi:hypothetical protein
MIVGAVAISLAEATDSEQQSWRAAMERECDRYTLDRERVALTMQGEDPLSAEQPKRRWWEPLIVAVAVALFIWLAAGAQRPATAVSVPWMITLIPRRRRCCWAVASCCGNEPASPERVSP